MMFLLNMIGDCSTPGLVMSDTRISDCLTPGCQTKAVLNSFLLLLAAISFSSSFRLGESFFVNGLMVVIEPLDFFCCQHFFDDAFFLQIGHRVIVSNLKYSPNMPSLSLQTNVRFSVRIPWLPAL